MADVPVRFPLLQGGALDRTVRRMAFEISEKSGASHQLVFIAVEGSGKHLADRIAGALHAQFGVQIPVHTYLRNGGGLEALDASDHVVTIIDDVIFSGATLFELLSRSEQLRRANRVQIAVLVDRGHRRFPLQADVVGLMAPTKLDEHIEVIYTPDGAHVTLIKAAQAAV